MLAKTLPKLRKALPHRHFSNLKWHFFINDTSTYLPTSTNYIYHDKTDIQTIISDIPFGPKKIFNSVYELTTELVVHISETMNMGWATGVLLGTFLVR